MAGIASSEIAPKTEFSTAFLQEHFSILHLDHRQCLQNAQSVPAGTLRSLASASLNGQLPGHVLWPPGKLRTSQTVDIPGSPPLENDQMFLQERFAE
jgi:hypothetical protein